MLSLLIAICGIFITIFFVIGTHEAAHFLAARALGVKVLRFSIGFGKILFRFRDKKETEYAFSLIPLGGYVKMLDEREEAVPEHEKPLAFNNQPFYKKFLIVLAGPAANIFCAIFLYWFIFVFGFTTVLPVIGHIRPDSIAAKAGMQPNQEIIAIDQHAIITWQNVLLRLLVHLGNDDTVHIVTKSLKTTQTHTYSLNVTHWKMDELNPDPLSSLGMWPYTPPVPMARLPDNMLKHVKLNPLEALKQAASEVVDFTYLNILLFGKLFTGKLSMQSLGGPITIFVTAGTSLNYGLLPFLAFLAFLSISLGVINLLPIPGLDGGHLFIQLIEVIIRRPIPEKIVVFFYKMGLFFIIFVLLQALVNDILRLY